MGFTDFVTPESSPHRNDGKLGQDNGTTDCSSNLLAALDTQTNVTVIITNS